MSRAAVAPGSAGLGEQFLAATSGAVFADRGDIGRLGFEGKDAAGLLHRLTTNAVRDLAEGEGTATVFATSKGRIRDLVTLHRLPGGWILAHCAAGRAAAVTEWVERYTFREDVRVVDWTASHRTGTFAGPDAATAVEGLFGAGAASRPRHHVARVEAGGIEAWLARSFPLAGEGYTLTAGAAVWPDLRRAILDGGRGRVRPVGEECLEILRIASGMPAHGRELTEDYNPWEARLEDAVSLTKGCYVGQEVIARLRTYSKVSKQLVRLGLHEAAPEPGAAVVSDGEASGVVTSSAALPDGSGRVVALAYVRDEDAVPGRRVTIQRAGGECPATIEGVAR